MVKVRWRRIASLLAVLTAAAISAVACTEGPAAGGPLAVQPVSIKATASPGTPRLPGLAPPKVIVKPAAVGSSAKASVTPSNLMSTGDGSWVWQNPLPQGNHLNAVACPTTIVCFAVGSQTIIATTNGGASWSVQHPGLTASLNGISCPSATICYAVGDGGVILATTNGGVTWISQDSGGAGSLYGVSCPSVTTCFASGGRGDFTKGTQIVSTTNGGATWALLDTTGVDGYVHYGISCPAPNICIAVGPASIARTADGGQTWDWNGIIGANLNGISCPTSSTCVAVGDSGAIETTTNGGTSWAAAPGIPPALFRAVSCPNTNTCAVAGDGFLSTTDGGSHWNGNCCAGGSLRGVSCSTATHCLGVGADGVIVSTVDFVTWSSTLTDNPLLFAAAVACTTLTKCLAVGRLLNGDVAVAGTTDGGNSWSGRSTPPIPGGLVGIACPSSTICFAVGPSGTILKTIDAGATWSSQTSGTTEWINGVSCPSTTVCFAVTNNAGILATTDGTSWSPQSSGLPFTSLEGVACTSVSSCLVAGFQGTILATTNGGQTWSPQNSGTSGDLVALTCPSSTTCYATGSLGTIIATTNWGSAWSNQSSGISTYLYSVSCASTYSCVSVGDFGVILGTRNAGTTWLAQISGTRNFLGGVSCPGAGRCFAVGQGGTILASEPVAPDPPTDVTAYPGDGSATITWSAPLQDGGSPVIGYVVTPYANGTPGPSIRFNQPNTTEAVINLANGSSYTFTVTAITSVGIGLPSAQSNAVTPTTGFRVPPAQGPSTSPAPRSSVAQSSPAPPPHR